MNHIYRNYSIGRNWWFYLYPCLSFFQLNLGIYAVDKSSELSVLVDRATGGASIKDGEVELMLHRFIFIQNSGQIYLTSCICGCV